MTAAASNPILRALTNASDGRFPPIDGGLTFVSPFAGPDGASILHAVVAFTGHAFIATSVDPHLVIAAGADGYGMASSPAVLSLLGGLGGTRNDTGGGTHGEQRDGIVGGTRVSFGVTDATMFARGHGRRGREAVLPVRTDLGAHHRVRHARSIRHDVIVYGDERGLVTLGRGLAGRLELSVEAASAGQGKGWGRSLIVDALSLVDEDQAVFAAVAPGNARSIRAFLALGFTIIGSETIIIIGPGAIAVAQS